MSSEKSPPKYAPPSDVGKAHTPEYWMYLTGGWMYRLASANEGKIAFEHMTTAMLVQFMLHDTYNHGVERCIELLRDRIQNAAINKATGEELLVALSGLLADKKAP
jgi:hypothetical protein